jgi:uncharacterized membrane protein (DUF4010 family)
MFTWPLTLSDAAHSPVLTLSVALGIGLLVGAERERRKRSGPQRAAAGIRSFAVAALMGAVAMLLGGIMLLALVVVITGVCAVLGYLATYKQDPGLTTELALVLTALLGGMAAQDALTAAAIGVVLAALLAARTPMHRFVTELLTERDLRDALILAAAALIALPLAPNRFMGPFDALNPHQLVMLVIVAMLISAAGYISTRWLGPRVGLPLAGLASGFVSSTATIAAMGQRARREPALTGAATAAAVLSSIATIVQMTVLIALVEPALVRALAVPLLAAGLAASAYGAYVLWQSPAGGDQPPIAQTQDGAFSLRACLGFAGVLALVMLACAALNAWLGPRGILIGALVGGLADAHSAAASAASLMAAGKIQASQAMLPVLLGLSANTLTKAVVAWTAGGAAYAKRIFPGLAAMMAAVWAGYALTALTLL